MVGRIGLFLALVLPICCQLARRAAPSLPPTLRCDLGQLFAAQTLTVAAIDLRLQHPPPHGLLADANLLGHRLRRGRQRRILREMVADQSHSTSLDPSSSIFLGMVRILSTHKDAASNLGRFNTRRQSLDPSPIRTKRDHSRADPYLEYVTVPRGRSDFLEFAVQTFARLVRHADPSLHP
jgi:hypothetical protein